MAKKSYLGHAPAIQQTRSYTVAGTWANGDKIRIPIDNIDLDINIGNETTPSEVATTVKQVWNNEPLDDAAASSSPPTTGDNSINGGGKAIAQFAEVEASASGAVFTLKVTTYGYPVTIGAPSVIIGIGTVTPGTLTPATGPNHADNPDNWKTNGTPGNNDEVSLDAGNPSLLNGLDFSAVQFASITSYKAWIGKAGRPNVNKVTEGRSYGEYRDKSFKTGHNSVTTVSNLGIGKDDGPGSPFYRHDGTNGRNTWNVYGSGQSEEAGVPPVLLAGTHASNELNNWNGIVGFGFYPDEPSTLAILRTGSGGSSQAETYCGPAVDLTNCVITIDGGKLTTNSPLCTATGSILLVQGDVFHQFGTVKGLTINGGTWHQLCGGTIQGTLTVSGGDEFGGVFDKSGNGESITFTAAIVLKKGFDVRDPTKSFAVGTQITFDGCDIGDGKFVGLKGRTIQIIA